MQELAGGTERREATYQDVLDAPDDKIAEVIDGSLELSPRPTGRHACFTARLLGRLDGPFQLGMGGLGGWMILVEPEVHLGRDIVVPDLAGWRNGRQGSLDVPFFTVAPDWICEVLSPSTERTDRKRKPAIYSRERIAHFWIANPADRTVTVQALGSDGRWVVLDVLLSDEKVRAPPFEAVELDLALLWGP